VRWMQPAGSAPVDYWSVYRDGELALWGILADPVDGIYQTEVPAWPTAATYWMTASNAAGESMASNSIQLPEPPFEVGLLVLVSFLLLGWGVKRWTLKSGSGSPSR
jgi:hypothetical protein